jgi:hypothetical protein
MVTISIVLLVLVARKNHLPEGNTMIISASPCPGETYSLHHPVNTSRFLRNQEFQVQLNTYKNNA